MDFAKSLVFEWQNAIFAASIVFWLIYLFISLMGSGGDDALTSHEIDKDIDLHHMDKDIDIHHGNSPQEGFSLLSYLGIGRCPVSIVLMLLGVSWGFVGLVCNGVFHALWVIPPLLYFWISATIALIIALPFTSFMSRIIARIMPRKGTTAISLESLVGKTGESSVTIDSKSGRVRVRDDYNSLHNIYCRTSPEDNPIPPNKEVLILSRGTDGFFVVKIKPKIILKN